MAVARADGGRGWAGVESRAALYPRDWQRWVGKSERVGIPVGDTGHGNRWSMCIIENLARQAKNTSCIPHYENGCMQRLPTSEHIARRVQLSFGMI